MITPAQERALLDAVALGIAQELDAAYAELLRLMSEGEAPRDAVAAVLATFQGQYAETLATAFTGILGRSVGSSSVLAMTISGVALSARLYRQSRETGQVVTGIVNRHIKGWQDARKLTLELYEGYGFRDREPLRVTRSNARLPKYLRQELLTDPGITGELARHFANVQASKLKTPALKAAYLEFLGGIQAGAGQELLRKRMRVAFHERMRYFANRIAQTELHRAYADRQATELMNDPDIVWVQYRLSVTHPRMDICDLWAKQDKYGLGPGVYPKAKAPKAPCHPHCRCVVSPRLDISADAKSRLRPGSERAYLRSVGKDEAARVMGSKARRDAVLNGADPLAVWNSNSDPMYRVRLVGDVARDGAPGLGVVAMSDQKLARDVMPNVDNPIPPTSKIRGYVLSFENEEGRHKARVLSAAFGLTDSDADVAYLASALVDALPRGIVARERETKWGKKFDVELAITGRNAHVENISTTWQYDHGSDRPRLVTAFLRGKRNERT